MARISSSAASATKCVQTDLPRPTPGASRYARRRARARSHDHRGIRAVHPRPQHDAVNRVAGIKSKGATGRLQGRGLDWSDARGIEALSCVVIE
jgi:hypothetical protein